MKKTITKILVAVMILTVAGTYSCKNRSTTPKLSEMNEIEKQGLEQKIEENVYPLPTSAEVLKKLTDLDLGYILGATNPPASARNYVSSYNRSVNLGVFGADLSYATLYNMQQDVIDYLAAMRTLAGDLNLQKIYDESLYDLIRENFDNRDTLVSVLTDAFDRTYSLMVDGGQANLALLMVGGAWVEGMYLTTHVSEAAYQVAGISRNLLEQKEAFNTFLEVTKPYENEEDISNFLAILEPIKKVYEGLGTSLTQQNIIDITKAIEGIRAQIIK